MYDKVLNMLLYCILHWVYVLNIIKANNLLFNDGGPYHMETNAKQINGLVSI